jgi:hypothetical protein
MKEEKRKAGERESGNHQKGNAERGKRNAKNGEAGKSAHAENHRETTECRFCRSLFFAFSRSAFLSELN